MGFSKLGLIFIFLLLQCDLVIPTRSMVARRLATRGAGGGGGRRGSGFVGGGSGGGGGGGGGGGSFSTGKGWGNNGRRINPPGIPYRHGMIAGLTGAYMANHLHHQGASGGHTLNCTKTLSYLVLTMLIYLLLSRV